jgi:hypothetical protein
MNIFVFLAIIFALISSFAAVKVTAKIITNSNLYKSRSSKYLLVGSIEAYAGIFLNVLSQSLRNNWVFFGTVLVINLAVYHFLCWIALIWTGEKIKYGNILARPKAKNALAISLMYMLFAFWMSGDDFNTIWLADAEKIVSNFWLWSARIIGLSFAAFGMLLLFIELVEEGKRRKDTTKAWSEFSFYSYQIIVVCSIIFLWSGLIRVIFYGIFRENRILQIFTIIGYAAIFIGLTTFTFIVLFDKRLLPIYEIFSQARCRALLAKLKTLYTSASEKFPVGYRVDPYKIQSPRYALIALVENLQDIRRIIWNTEAWRLAEQTGKAINQIDPQKINEIDMWIFYLGSKENAALADKYKNYQSPENLVPEIRTHSVEQAADYFVAIADEVEKI